MILHHPEITKKDGKVTVAARIETKQDIPRFPHNLWFSFPEEYALWVSDRSDGFVIGALRMAMYFNEPLQVYGFVSPLLAYNMRECQRIFIHWFPDVLNFIDVSYQNLSVPSSEQVAGAVGLSFSGGVDSTFSLLKHLPKNQSIPHVRVTHLLFNQGFNRADFDNDSYHAALEKFQALANRLDLKIIPANTNSRDLSEPWIDWEVACHSSLMGTPLILSNLFSTFIVPSTLSYAEIQRPFGNSPLVDHLFSTETMKFIHHGASYTRMQKVAEIGPWEEAQSNLRVCLNPGGNSDIYNCSRCEKCIGTMTMLKISGDLDKFQTFRLPFRYRNILYLGLHYSARFPLWWFTSYAIEKKRYHLIIPVVIAYFIGWLKNIITMLLPDYIKRPLKKLIYPEHQKKFQGK